MEEEQDFTKAREELEEKRKEWEKVRSELTALAQEREAFFTQLRTIRESIKTLNTQLAPLKQERDELTKKVKALKQERDQFNVAVKEKSQEKKTLEEKQKALQGHLEVKENPSYLKAQIDKLEKKIETEIVPFEEEKRLRKTIKEMREKYKQIGAFLDAGKEVRGISADFSQARRKAQERHHEIQDLARQSQEKHEQAQKLYEEIKQLREKEHPLVEKHTQLAKQVAEKRTLSEEIHAQIKQLSSLFQQEDQKSMREKIAEKTAQVQEKLKTKKKLRMEDILAFQASKE